MCCHQRMVEISVDGLYLLYKLLSCILFELLDKSVCVRYDSSVTPILSWSIFASRNNFGPVFPRVIHSKILFVSLFLSILIM